MLITAARRLIRDFNIPRAIPLFAALWGGFGFWEVFPVHLGDFPMNDPIKDVLARLDSAANDGRKFHVMLVGSSEDIYEAIHTLHVLGFAEVALWSALMPVPNSTNLMSILTRHRGLRR